ncbi:LysR substrate-binding domain-containing protein (plasmid) [Sinorhizobium meliloti]|uniref:LysR substrate-binding domain-containing protein n=1 Tax=Rhizobium meliloti TaxID=382 RepID=UPI002D76FEE4|nr:LysR substrate-binding domain-containing protein [Sinorhizobium meliloti]WRQ70157.1 LysR substrate-binding domain-containing protein [Sinorhizobium meliloti]
MIQLRHVRAFLAVADTGSIRMAALRLNVSQPALSKTIQELEEILSVPLYTRSAHGSSPTEFGRAFLHRARIIDTEFSRAQEEISQMVGSKGGKVAVGISAIAAMLMASHALQRFWKMNPNVNVRISDGLLDRLIGGVRQGEFDFAVGGVSPTSLAQDLTIEPLFENSIVPVVRAGHPLSNATSLKDLAGADWLFTNDQPTFMALMNRYFTDHGAPPPRVLLTCESFSAVLDILPSTNLVAALPKSCLTHPLMRDRIVGLALTEGGSHTTVGLVSRAGVPLTPLAAGLAKAFRQVGMGYNNLGR